MSNRRTQLRRPLAESQTSVVRRPPISCGVTNRTTTLSTTTAATLATMNQAHAGNRFSHTRRCDVCAAPFAFPFPASDSPSASQSGSTSTHRPRLAYHPQLRQIVTEVAFCGAPQFVQHGPVDVAEVPAASSSCSITATELSMPPPTDTFSFDGSPAYLLDIARATVTGCWGQYT